MNPFNLEAYLEFLKKQYAHLNDNDATANAVYEKLLSIINK